MQRWTLLLPLFHSPLAPSLRLRCADKERVNYRNVKPKKHTTTTATTQVYWLPAMDIAASKVLGLPAWLGTGIRIAHKVKRKVSSLLLLFSVSVSVSFSLFFFALPHVRRACLRA